jgi:hypothetical protein
MNLPADLIPGDVLLYSGTSFFSKVIEVKTFSAISHVEVYFGDGKTVTARPEGANIYDFTPVDLAEVRRPTFPIDIKRAEPWLNAIKGMPYGWPDMEIFAGLKAPNDGSLVCSEVSAMLLHNARTGELSTFATDADLRRIAPAHFQLSPLLIPILKAV